MGKKKQKAHKMFIEPDREYVTIEEAADGFRVRPNMIRQWIREGILQTTDVFVEQDGGLHKQRVIVRESCRELVRQNIINAGKGPGTINRSDT